MPGTGSEDESRAACGSFAQRANVLRGLEDFGCFPEEMSDRHSDTLRLPMAVKTELRTERLLLRPFQARDVDDALAYRNDPEFGRFLPHVPQPFTLRDAEEFVRRN